jgi:hypothetical protein
MKTHQLISGVGLLLLIVSLPMPWLSVNILGQYNLTLMDIYRVIFNASQQLPSGSSSSTEQFNSMIPSVGAMMIAILLYPISLIVAIVSLLHRKASLVAGVLSVATGLLWVFGIDALKGALIDQMKNAGGMFGSLTQAYASLIMSAISFGYGAIVPIVGGIVLLVAFFLKEASTPASPASESIQPPQTPN